MSYYSRYNSPWAVDSYYERLARLYEYMRKYNYYGPPRYREPCWIRDCEGHRRRSSDPEITSPKPKPKPVKPEPAKEFNKALEVKSVNLFIDDNTKAHRTDKYECTDERKDEKTGEMVPAELVIRRGGEPVKVGITFGRPFDDIKNDMKIKMTIGGFPKPTNGTQALFDVDETGKKEFKSTEWGANLKSKSGNDIMIKIHVPADCIIGEWNFFVQTFSMGKNEKGEDTKITSTYEHDVDFNIIFNPWCKADGTYMEKADLLDEYVLEDSGLLYSGNAYNPPSAFGWVFGQFEDKILEAAFKLLRDGFGEKFIHEMSDPVMVSRVIAKMVNSSGDNGVLEGNWSGDYKGGESPGHWKGSVKILQQYLDEEKPVKYGQCWVFSGVTTTVCRALGLPCRSVTNFSSAHDTDKNNTIETYWEFSPENGLTKAEWGGDSVWNFHVWNECWLARPDLKDPDMHGWQAFDATPQEASELRHKRRDEVAKPKHVYTCGPCPVAAVKKGMCDVMYDAGFIFSEVNADRHNWIVFRDEIFYMKKPRSTRSIGINISTKQPGEDSRLDLTNEYKYPEGSKDEREAVKTARLKAAKHKKEFDHIDVTDTDDASEPMTLKIKHTNELELGLPLPINVLVDAKDIDSSASYNLIVVVGVFATDYTGNRISTIMTDKYIDTMDAGKQNLSFMKVLTPDLYSSKFKKDNGYNIEIEATLFANYKTGDKYQSFFSFKEHVFHFKTPDLIVKGPEKAAYGEEIKLEVSFTNPLHEKLTECKLYVECNGMDKDFRAKYPMPKEPVGPKQTFTATVPIKIKKKLRPERAGYRRVVVTFDSKELVDIYGLTKITMMIKD